MSPMRLLAICTGTKCEFCDQDLVDDFHASGPISSGITLRVRPHLGVKCCWTCLNYSRKRKTLSSPNKAIHSKLTTSIYKVHDHALTEFYLSNRETLYEIWCHDRILAYPYGLRYLDEQHDGTLVPVGNRYDAYSPVESYDAFEIMWKEPTLDNNGNPCGPIMTASLLQDLVSYLGQEDNLGIDHFLDYVVKHTSRKESYVPILKAYDESIEDAEHAVQERMLNAQAQLNIKRFKAIDLAMKGIDKIIKRTSTSDIKWWLKEMSMVKRPQSYLETQRRLMTRTLLLYREIPYHKGTWVLTYDTGCPELNRTIHDVLGDFLKKPKHLSSDEVYHLARTLYKRSRDILRFERVEGVLIDSSTMAIRREFSARWYRRQYRPSPAALSKFPEWKDTSPNRKL